MHDKWQQVTARGGLPDMMHFMSRVYSFNEYDKYCFLKVGTALWLVIGYLLRPFVILSTSLTLGRAGSNVEHADGLQNILYPDNFSLTLGILATIPALLFVYVWVKRRPGAGARVRWLWQHGVLLLVVAAILNIVIVFVPLLNGSIARIHEYGWIQNGIAVAIIVYLLSSGRVRDTFADFPSDQV